LAEGIIAVGAFQAVKTVNRFLKQGRNRLETAGVILLRGKIVNGCAIVQYGENAAWKAMVPFSAAS
jgi:hypothetical protein